MSEQTRILLVEDNPDNHEIFRTILEHFGFEVHHAWTAEEGLEMVGRVVPRVILMDIGLPGMDGVSATRILKSDPATAGIPVLAITAHALTEDRNRALEAGFDAYLTKPIEPKEVVAAVMRWTGPPQPDPGQGSGG
ncbi:response regulator [Longimicrobium sp.]|jgi:CheY-like chemotaxis protein|uniref:response regulator n=1 Tax=Longimicrobium sp. TaxID=2029185 RepID=UPI002EDA1A6B